VSDQPFTDLVIAQAEQASTWTHNDKMSGRALAESAGVPVPTLLAGPGPLKDLPLPDGPFVVKPVRGSSMLGVRVLVPESEGRHRDLVSGRTRRWGGWREELYKVKGQGYNRDTVRNPWILEALIGDGTTLPEDWKVYCLHGTAHLVRQINRTGRTVRSRSWTAEWTPALNALRSRPCDTSLPPPRHGPELIAAAEAIARLHGTVFVRVDLYDADDGPVFGEVTPNPAAGKRPLSPEWEQRLADVWLNE